jgi:hypothetical protein
MMKQLTKYKTAAQGAAKVVWTKSKDAAKAFEDLARQPNDIGVRNEVAKKVKPLKDAADVLQDESEKWRRIIKLHDDSVKVVESGKGHALDKKELKENCASIRDYLNASEDEAASLIASAKWYQLIFDVAKAQGIPVEYVK